MKKAILALVLGISFSGLTAFGQGGVVLFSNYYSAGYNPVVYGDLYTPPGSIGKNVNDANVELQLYYAYGTYTDFTSFMAHAVAGVTTFINTNLNASGVYGTPTSIGSPGGYYSGPTQLLPDWVPGDTVTFMVEAWQTAGLYGGPTYDSSLLNGRTDLWTETGTSTFSQYGINLHTLPTGYFAAGPPVLVLGTPEPATLALGGLGLAALMLCRRKRA